MVSKQEKIRAGAFVVVISVLFIAVLVSMRYYSSLEVTRDYYFLYRGSVFGLEEGSKVAYKGVPIGTVKEIGFSKKDLSVIKVVMAIKTPEEDLPILNDTKVRLNYVSLITGTLYVELEGGNGRIIHDPRKPLEVEYSILDNLGKKIDRLDTSVRKILGQVTDLLKKENRELFAQLLSDVRDTAADMKGITSDARKLVVKVDESLETARNSLKENREDIRAVVKETAAALRTGRQLLDQAKQADLVAAAARLMNKADQALGTVDASTKEIVSIARSMGEKAKTSLDATVSDLGQLKSELNKTLAALRQTLATGETKVGEVSANLDEVADSVKSLADKMDRVIQHSDELLNHVSGLVTNSSSDVRTALSKLRSTAEKLDRLVNGLNALVISETPTVTRLIRNLKQASSELNEFSRQIRQQPSTLIGKSPKDVRKFKK